eukprot:gene20096-20002_t
MVMRNNSKEPGVQQELNNLRQHPQTLIEFDPLYNHDIMGRFSNVLAKGEDSGITWRYVVMARYHREEDEDGDMRKNVVDRKYYEGLMDNEIPIRMYVRYMKPIPGKPQQFDGLYKLGDNRKYVRLEINRTEDGRWIIEDENFVGTMELKLTGRTYTGGWTNAEENGFD